MTKYWDDYDDEMEIRPDSISVTLYREDVSGNVSSVIVRTLSEANDWTYSTADDTNLSLDSLKKNDDDGNAYTYYWTESTASFPAGYTQTSEKTWYDEDEETWYTEFTNSITVTVPVSVEKIWDDDSDAQGIRPATIYMRLYADGVWVDVNGDAVTSSTTADTAVVLNSGNSWKASLSGLPKYNSSGKEITYKFAELTYSTELIINGKKVTPAESEFACFTGSKTTGYYVSTNYNGTATMVTNTHTPSGEVTVYKKVLASDISLSGGEPEFTFTLTASDGTTSEKTITFTQDYVTANTDASGYVTANATFTGLEYGTLSVEALEFTISSSNFSGAFEATFEDEFVTEGGITVYKKVLASEIDWDEGEPEFTFTLTASDGTTSEKTITFTQDYVTANTDASGYVAASATFPDLEYGTYTLEETKMPENWEFVSLTCAGGTVSGKRATFTISKANAAAAVEATYVDRYNKPGAVTVYKKVLAEQIDWEDGNPSFTFTLTGADGSTESRTVTFTEDYVKANTDSSGYVKLGTTFEDLEYGTYTLEETEMPEGWAFVSLSASGGTVSGETATFTISRDNAWNTLEATFEDEYIRYGSITLTKYGSDGKTALSGVTFAISDEDGNLVDTQTTDENGQVVFEDLEIGTYRICETATWRKRKAWDTKKKLDGQEGQLKKKMRPYRRHWRTGRKPRQARSVPATVVARRCCST